MKFGYDKVKGAVTAPQNTLHWMMTFTSPPAGLNFGENMSILCDTATTPNPEVEHLQIQLQGQTLNFPGRINRSGTITLTFIQPEKDQEAIDLIYQWLNIYWENAGQMQGNTLKAPKELYATVKLSLYDATGQVETRAFELIDCLPQLENGAELGQEAAAMKPQLTLTYNNFHYYVKGKKVF